MFLAQLTIYGFKSFAKKTELSFSRGLSAVVGPNGCGKTNILDAIRWVIGEQKIKSLRSSSLQDVIFKGTREEKPMSMAEVHLKLKDCKGLLPYDPMAETVILGRRYYRSGDSEYLVNGRQVRLKDIQSILMGTGIGSSVYALIERSMIHRILSGRKDDRRELFEEASGIMKYKYDRKSSESKLRTTETDIERLGDIIIEVGGQVAFLKRQMRRAKDLERLKGRAAKLATQIAFNEYARLKASLAVVAKELSAKEEELALLNAKKTELETRRETLVANRDEKAMLVNKAGEVLRKVESGIARGEKEHAVLEERMNNAERGIEASGATIQSQELRERELSAQIEEAEAKLVELRRIAVDIKADADRFALEHAEAEKDFTALRKLVSERRSELSTAEAALARVSANIESARGQIGIIDEQISQIETSATGHTSSLEHKRKSLDELTISLKSHETNFIEAKGIFEAAEAELERIRARKSELYDIIGRLGGEVVSIRAKLISLEEAAKRGDLDKAVREKITERGAIGRVVELIEPADLPAPAIDLILGEIARAWVVPDERTAKAVAEIFVEAKIPAILVVLDELPNPTSSSAIAKAGAERLTSLLNGWSLGDGTGKFVAQDGEFLREPGIRRIGKPAGAPVTRAVELKNTRAELASKEAEEKSANEALQKVISDEDLARRAVDSARNALHSAEKAFRTAENSHREMEFEVRSLESAIHSADSRAKDLAQRRTETAESIEANSRELSQLEAKVKHLSAELEELTEKQEKAELLSRERSKKATDEQMEYVRRKGEVSALEREISRMELQRKEAIAVAERARERAKELTEEFEACKTAREKFREEIQELFGNREQAESDLKEAGEKAQEAEESLRKLESELRETSNKLSALEKAVHEKSMQKHDFDMQTQWIRKNLNSEYSIDIEDVEVEEELDELQEQNAKIKLDRLKTQIADFGGVDPEAEDKFNEENQRLEFLTAQRDDLVEAGKELRKTIRKLDNLAREEFTQTFEKTRLHFRQIFTELFEGGEADLKLEEGVDILEADVIIEARPRGKRFLTMGQLSDGEKSLCALSLLFGLYKVKPSPFCMLDEVDAPLDDANIGRFLRLIRRFSDETQFILITHNKRTMEAVDYLYGVTMQEHGISKAISLKLSDLSLDLEGVVAQ